MKYTKVFSPESARKADTLRRVFLNAEAVLIGAGAGLSTAAGYTYSGERFKKHFADFEEKYGFHDMYTGGFYPYNTSEEYWAYWALHIAINRYTPPSEPVYTDLLEAVKSKDYFVLTTNVDHCFQRAGFDKQRLFYTQGDYGLFQCSVPCHDATYDNREAVLRMVAETKNARIPSELVPHCPLCGAKMTMNLRSDNTFVQDDGWYAAYNRYSEFVKRHKKSRILYLEIGVGGNTPAIIKYPFWNYTAENANAVYACVNDGEAFCPREIANRAICIDGDACEAIRTLNPTG